MTGEDVQAPDAAPPRDGAASDVPAPADGPLDVDAMPSDGSCRLSCAGRRCGDDGCGGSCGGCPSNSSTALECTQFGICKCNPSCTSSCDDKRCGDDGCGGSCGVCGVGEACAYDRARSPAWECRPFSPSAMMSFFVTSEGNGARGGNLGGVAGADERCRSLAERAGVRGKAWRAYLSVAGEPARERIGRGPWINAAGERIVDPSCDPERTPRCIEVLHRDGVLAERMLTERGTQIDWANAHDIMTGSDPDGDPTGADCRGWTSNAEADQATVGHSNALRADGISDSWNSAHNTQCDEVGLQCTAGRGHLYCFAL